MKSILFLITFICVAYSEEVNIHITANDQLMTSGTYKQILENELGKFRNVNLISGENGATVLIQISTAYNANKDLTVGTFSASICVSTRLELKDGTAIYGRPWQFLYMDDISKFMGSAVSTAGLIQKRFLQ